MQSNGNGPQAPTDPPSVILSPVLLPKSDNVEFHDTTFFESVPHAEFPTPEVVRQRNLRLHPNLSPNYQRPPPVAFAELNLMVKYGADITTEEGQCYWFMQRYMTKGVPGPQIFGWRRDKNETFLYMELIDGDTLDSVWSDLSESSRLKLCAQLRSIVYSWRQLSRGEDEGFVGNINGHGLRDVYLQMTHCDTAGPFDNAAEFHDWLARRPNWDPSTYDPDDPYLAGFWADQPLVFTHGDLHKKNILVSRADDGPIRIVAVLDWHQSGWYPRDWEYLKTTFTTFWNGEWAQKYVPLFIDPCSEEYALAFESVKSFFGC